MIFHGLVRFFSENDERLLQLDLCDSDFLGILNDTEMCCKTPLLKKLYILGSSITIIWGEMGSFPYFYAEY